MERHNSNGVEEATLSCSPVLRRQILLSESQEQGLISKAEAPGTINAPVTDELSMCSRWTCPDAARDVKSACPSSPRHSAYADMDMVDTVKGLQGLKASLASHFVSAHISLPENFRCGYIVDLDQHWVSVHAIFHSTQESSCLSLVVFDTLEVNYQQYHEVGLLRSSHAESEAEHQHEPRTAKAGDGNDVATLCEMLGIRYDISFLAPICDVRRLTWEEEEEIKSAVNGGNQRSPSIYYDRQGNPFRKVIVQPVLQAERDGSCKSRALAVLGWLLRLDAHALAWYVSSRRARFHVELRVRPPGRGVALELEDDAGEEPLETTARNDAECVYGSLMSTGRRDKFGRSVHMKVCHADTLLYNQYVDEGCSATIETRFLPGQDMRGVLLPADSREVVLRKQRDSDLSRIKEVVLGKSADDEDSTCAATDSAGSSSDGEGGRSSDDEAARGARGWRAIEDHEARWRFLEETCFFWRNLGFKKIKAYPRERIGGDGHIGFGKTRYLRKYMGVSPERIVTHEADPMFQQPLESFLSFLCSEEHERETVPFFVLPFPGKFMTMSLSDHVEGDVTIDLEGDPKERRRQRVSDFSIPEGNRFLNDPNTYNNSSANVIPPALLA